MVEMSSFDFKRFSGYRAACVFAMNVRLASKRSRPSSDPRSFIYPSYSLGSAAGLRLRCRDFWQFFSSNETKLNVADPIYPQ